MLPTNQQGSMAVSQSGMSSYFDLPQRQSHRSESSEPVSPLSEPRRTPSHLTTKPLRPQYLESARASSDNTHLRSRSYARVNRDKRARGCSTPASVLQRIRQSMEFDDGTTNVLEEDSLISTTMQAASCPPTANSSPESGSGGGHGSLNLSKAWKSALSKKSTAEGSSGDTNTPSVSMLHKNHGKPMVVDTSLIKPLRPPSIVTRQSDPQSEHRVRIEKSFTDLRALSTSMAEPPPHSRRTSSIDPKQLLRPLSASIDVFRRRNKKGNGRRQTNLPGEERRLGRFAVAAQDHRTNLRKDQTALGLARVSSMLQELKMIDANNREISAKVASPYYEKDMRHASRNNELKSPTLLGRVKSMEMKLEDVPLRNLSVDHFDLELTPHNTPEEKATYTVINQSGTPEEFLKVDISIRGQTSYLPSEARRIHTPPSPSADRGGRARGFFFDYNSPNNGHSQAADLSARAKVGKDGDTALRTVSKFTKQLTSPAKKQGTRVKTGDWYATQLAELDSLDEIGEGPSQIQFHSANTRTVSKFEIRQQRAKDEEKLDLNIPEHLPTSPLCPRHPRYWRIIKGKGSQLRSCWMHGFGEFTEADMAKYGIVDVHRNRV